MTTILTSFSLVPELQYWFNKFVVSSTLNKGNVPPPVSVALQYMPENSFIEMLFNDSYNKSSYEYRYLDETNVGCIPRACIARLQIYPGSWSYLNLDSDGENIFALQPHDFVLLDTLLAFRNGASDSTSLLFIDSTSVSLVSDTTAGIYILYGNYNSLSTVLSKLIYLFLRLEVLEDFDLYNNESLVSHCGLIETCYEAYLMEKYFTFMTEREPNLVYNCEPCS